MHDLFTLILLIPTSSHTSQTSKNASITVSLCSRRGVIRLPNFLYSMQKCPTNHFIVFLIYLDCNRIRKFTVFLTQPMTSIIFHIIQESEKKSKSKTTLLRHDVELFLFLTSIRFRSLFFPPFDVLGHQQVCANEPTSPMMTAAADDPVYRYFLQTKRTETSQIDNEQQRNEVTSP